jgi:hypothetical protein
VVSTVCMRSTKIFRVVGWLVVGLCAIPLALALAIRVDQYLLRKNADHLLADLKSLEMRRSTYGDARAVIDRWHDNIREGPCRPSWCDVEISLGDFLARHTFLAYHQKLADAYRLLGGRPAMIEGSIRVRNNVVWGKGIVAYIESHAVSGSDGLYFTVIGQARSGSPSVVSLLHPEYAIGTPGGCTACTEAYVVFTPYADPADVKRLMDIDFSCLTRWHPCETNADILPTAWNEQTAARLAMRKLAERTCSPDVVRVLSRESWSVLDGEITKIEPSAEYGELTLHLHEDLKRWDLRFRYRLARQEYSFSQPMPLKEELGDRYVVFFQYPNSTYAVGQGGSCEVLPATQENMEAVRRGVAEDWADHLDYYNQSPGLADVKPPTIHLR